MSKMCLKTILLAEGPPEHAVHHTWKKTSRCAQRKSSWQCWDQGTKSKEGCATMWNHDPRKALGYKMKYQFDSELLDRILKGWFRIEKYSFDSESWFGSFGILLDWIISTNCCLNSGGPAGAMWDGEGATRKSRSVGPLYSVNKLH